MNHTPWAETWKIRQKKVHLIMHRYGVLLRLRKEPFEMEMSR